MKYTLPILLCLLLASCGPFGAVTSGPNPFAVTPSRPPSIITATPILILPTTSATLPPPPSLTPSSTTEFSPTFTSTNESPTFTFTPTETASLTPTFTVAPAPVRLTILGCGTGLDITHGMGEVTNAYVTLVNPSGSTLTNACLTLAAADEGRAHPDKTVCVPALQTGFQVTLKLTVDTTTNTATLVQVALTSDQLSLPPNPVAACPALTTAPANLGISLPIP